MPILPLAQDDLDHLVCPVCHAPLTLAASTPAIHCLACNRVYPVVDGLPVLLAARATQGANS